MALTMLKTLPARLRAESYSRLRSPVASPTSIRRKWGIPPDSACRLKFSTAGVKVPPAAASKGVRRVSELGDRASYEADEREPRREHAQLGDRVAHVLNAAEEAADQIRADARREGVRIIKEAEATAATRVDELTREAEQLREDADDYARDIRSAVDSYATQQRRDAEEEARRVLSEAETQARATREASQEMSEQMQQDARRRHEMLQRESKALEERRQRVVEGLRDLSAQLQDALVEPVRQGRDEESLTDALDFERRR